MGLSTCERLRRVFPAIFRQKPLHDPIFWTPPFRAPHPQRVCLTVCLRSGSMLFLLPEILQIDQPPWCFATSRSAFPRCAICLGRAKAGAELCSPFKGDIGGGGDSFDFLFARAKPPYDVATLRGSASWFASIYSCTDLICPMRVGKVFARKEYSGANRGHSLREEGVWSMLPFLECCRTFVQAPEKARSCQCHDGKEKSGSRMLWPRHFNLERRMAWVGK